MSANNQAAGAMNALGMTPPENDLRDAVADILLQELIVRRGYDSVGRAADWIDGKDIAVDRILSGPLAKARADLERVTAERDEAVAGLTRAAANIEKLSAAIHNAAPVLEARALAAEAENTRLSALLAGAVEALRPFAKLSFSFDGFSFEPAELVVLGHCCGKFHSKEHEHLQRAVDAAQATLAALDKASTPKPTGR